MKTSSIVATAALLATSVANQVTVVNPNEPFVPNNSLPPSHATTDGASIVKLFPNLSRNTVWQLVSKTPFQGDTGEPEGLVRVGDDRYFVSSGQWTVPTEKYPQPINGTDRTAGAGFAYMLIYDGQGTLIANGSLTEPGDIEYHTGGIDYDGRYIWDTLSQYRPNSTATIVKIDPLTLNKTSLFRTDDHNGGIVHDIVTDNLVTFNWGGRNATTWNIKKYPQGFAPLPDFTAPLSSVPDPSFFIDYQDCKFIGHHALPGTKVTRPIGFCGGVASIKTSATASFNLGGIGLIDIQTYEPLWEVPIGLTSDLGAPLTQNPIDIAVVNGKLRIYCLPDQHTSTLYVYEAT